MEMEFIFSVGFTPTSGVSVNVDLCECRVKRAALHTLNGSNKLYYVKIEINFVRAVSASLCPEATPSIPPPFQPRYLLWN